MVSTLNWILLAEGESAANSVSLSGIDWAVICAYFAIIAVVAVFAARGQNTASDFFLGSRNIGWFAIGGSLFASNVGSEHIVGLAGSGANTGLSLAHWELHAWVLLMLGWVFVPYYYRSKVFTMPEFLEKRFSPTARWILSIISLSAYVLTKVSVTVYAGALVFNTLFPDFTMLGLDAFWAGALLTVVLTGIYSVTGGLRAVLYTDACQAIILLLGSIFILYFGLTKLADGGSVATGWSNLRDFTAQHASQYALWHPNTDENFPWLAICIASPIIGLWYWCTDQYIVQRTLAARNLETARRGTIWGAALKVMPVMLFLIPGLIGAALNAKGFLDLRLKAEMDAGLVTSLTTDGDRVFPTLVTKLLPSGLRGLVIAGLLAALMSSLSSLFNSSASLFTIDIYQKLKKQASQKELVYVGKIATLVVVVLGIIWIPIMKEVAQGGGGLYDYLQNVQSFLAPAITATFLLGIFWNRINAHGAVWGLGVGFVLGMGKLTVQTFYGAKKIADPAILAQIGDFNPYYACGVLFVISAAVVIIVSLMTPAPDAKQIEGLTFASIDKKELRASIHTVDIVTTLIVVAMILGIYLYFSFWTCGKAEFTAFEKAKEEVGKAEKFIAQIDKDIAKAEKDIAEAKDNAKKKESAEKALKQAQEAKAAAEAYLVVANIKVEVEQAKESKNEVAAKAAQLKLDTTRLDQITASIAKAEKDIAEAKNNNDKKAAEKILKQAKDAKEKTEKEINELKAKAESSAGDVVSDTVNTVVEATDKASEATSEAVGGTMNAAGEATQDASNAVNDAIGGAMNAAGEATEDASNAINDAINGALNF